MADRVGQPEHYTSHPAGVEMTDIAEHFGFCLGNVIKYVWRANLKGEPVEDLRKAQWYLAREIERREIAVETVDIVDGTGAVVTTLPEVGTNPFAICAALFYRSGEARGAAQYGCTHPPAHDGKHGWPEVGIFE